MPSAKLSISPENENVNGSIEPVEHCGAHDRLINELHSQMGKNRDGFIDSLTAAQRERFQTYIGCSEAYLIRLMELAFCDGFCLGGS